MGLPNINIEFKTAGGSAVQRSQKGTAAIMVRDTAPESLSAESEAYLARAKAGYVNIPGKIIPYVIAGEGRTLETALSFFATQQFDYLAGPQDCTQEEAQKIAEWVKEQRAGGNMVKAVLPNNKADSEAVVNFTACGIEANGVVYNTAAYCSRIAGLLCGTPMNISCTYAQLPEVTAVAPLSKTELDKKVESGELVLFHDGEKVKIGRGVNSLQTVTAEKGEAFQKIKIVEALDMIRTDIRRTVQDSYIGKYANSYDNKCLLIVAVKAYLEELERAGILGSSAVEIDMEAQKGYLASAGKDTGAMNEQEIKEANTGSKVFLKAKISVLDAIEDVYIPITV